MCRERQGTPPSFETAKPNGAPKPAGHRSRSAARAHAHAMCYAPAHRRAPAQHERPRRAKRSLRSCYPCADTRMGPRLICLQLLRFGPLHRCEVGHSAVASVYAPLGRGRPQRACKERSHAAGARQSQLHAIPPKRALQPTERGAGESPTDLRDAFDEPSGGRGDDGRDHLRNARTVGRRGDAQCGARRGAMR